METMAERLKRAREQSRRFPSARQAGLHFYPGTSGTTYLAHENGQNDFKPEDAKRYGRAFGKAPGWLLTGNGPEEPTKNENAPEAAAVALKGYASAGAELYFDPGGDLGTVDIPEATPDTVAVEIRGNSLGAIFNRAIVVYDNVQSPLTSDLYGKLCVVGLEEGGVYIKKVQQARTRGRAHLYSETEEPILDAKVVWAAKVRMIILR